MLLCIKIEIEEGEGRRGKRERWGKTLSDDCISVVSMLKEI